MSSELSSMIPTSKFDTAAVERAIDAGFQAIEPILLDLLEWIKDGNWPTAGRLFMLFASVGEPVIPHIRSVLNGNDDVWKYWCLSLVGDLTIDQQNLLISDIKRIVNNPSEGVGSTA